MNRTIGITYLHNRNQNSCWLGHHGLPCPRAKICHQQASLSWYHEMPCKNITACYILGQDLLINPASGCLGILYLMQDYPNSNLRFRYQRKPSRYQMYFHDSDYSVGAVCFQQKRKTEYREEWAGTGEKEQPRPVGKRRGASTVCLISQLRHPFLRHPTTAKAWFWQALQKSGKKHYSLKIPLENVLGTVKKHIAEKNLMYGTVESSHMWNGSKLKMDGIKTLLCIRLLFFFLKLWRFHFCAPNMSFFLLLLNWAMYFRQDEESR